jgi:hypothetical protein
MALSARGPSPVDAGTRQLLALCSSLLVSGSLALAAVRIAGRGWSAAFGRAGHELLAFPAALGFVACPLRSLTGLACPGCGATRAGLALLRADLAAALALNPFLVLALATLLSGGIAALVAPRPTERWLAAAGRFARSRRGRALIVMGLVFASAWQTVHLSG